MEVVQRRDISRKSFQGHEDEVTAVSLMVEQQGPPKGAGGTGPPKGAGGTGPPKGAGGGLNQQQHIFSCGQNPPPTSTDYEN